MNKNGKSTILIFNPLEDFARYLTEAIREATIRSGICKDAKCDMTLPVIYTQVISKPYESLHLIFWSKKILSSLIGCLICEEIWNNIKSALLFIFLKSIPYNSCFSTFIVKAFFFFLKLPIGESGDLDYPLRNCFSWNETAICKVNRPGFYTIWQHRWFSNYYNPPASSQFSQPGHVIASTVLAGAVQLYLHDEDVFSVVYLESRIL